MCQILTQSARKSSGKGGRYNGRTTTADRAGTSKRKETSDKGRDRRKRTEVKAPSDRVTPPSYLTATQKKAFRKTVKELRAIDLISNLDVEALARLVIAQEKYREVTETIAKQPLMVTVAYDTGKKDAEGNPIMAEHEVVNSQVERLAIIQDRYFKQCRQGAADFGLTVSSRCRLIIPKAPEAPKTNKFKDKFA